MNNVSIRMYCLGTGDCFLLTFTGKGNEKFLIMIDCGSCQGTPEQFRPYLEDLSEYVKAQGGVDLLVVTHEHQDHVNGFQKCRDIFEDPDFEIREAWFSWTEHPEDPDDRVADLQTKRKKMRNGFANAMTKLQKNEAEIVKNFENDHSLNAVRTTTASFLAGLQALSDVNLESNGMGVTGEPLAGMRAIKDILRAKKTRIRYVNPGETKSFAKAAGLKFHILGPPYEQDAIFKDGKEGKDVYKRHLALDKSVNVAEFFNMTASGNGKVDEKSVPFENRYIVDLPNMDQIRQAEISMSFFDPEGNPSQRYRPTDERRIVEQYRTPENSWRKIDFDWLNSAGSLALRLNSHINNTSLAFAIEVEKTGDVILLPGDAEFGSWESWSLIKKWKKKGKGDKHLVEDLLSRVVFYKVSHHLSYNGTPLGKGIHLMPEQGMAAMVTLDRNRISSRWKSTMPNKELLQDLIRRCNGKVFIMDETEVKDAPSKFLDKSSLRDDEYVEVKRKNKVICKEYNLKL